MNGSTHLPRGSDEHYTCVSSISHAPANVLDHACHYGGCIEISERKDYFKDAKLWSHERTLARNKFIRENNWTGPLGEEQETIGEESVKKTILEMALEVDRELKRIEMLRGEIDGEEECPKKKSNYGQILHQSMWAWRQSSRYKDNINKVWKWRLHGDSDEVETVETRQDYTTLPRSRVPEEDLKNLLDSYLPADEKKYTQEHQQIKKQFDLHCLPADDKYDLMKDSKAYIIEFEYQKLELQSQYINTSGPPTPTPRAPGYFPAHLQPLRKKDEGEFYLKKYNEREHSSFRGSFPSQKVSVEDLLKKPDIMQPKTNRWIEQMIARFYGEERPNFEQIHDLKSPPTKSYNLLKPEYWRGQQHGGGDLPVHSRHLIPMCETPSMSMDNEWGEETSRALTLFMPYLHWETSRKRSMMADIIFNTAERERDEEEELRKRERKDRVEKREKLPKCGLPKIAHEPEQRDVGAVAAELTFQLTSNLIPRPTFAHPLARVLMNAAKLYESMALFRDEKMVQQYLFSDSPCHPRRTLDQSYYWTLRSTETRDRDQVVFRHTRPRGDHVFAPKKKPREHQHILRQFLTPKLRHRPPECPSCQRDKADQCRCEGKGSCVCPKLRSLKDDHCCPDCMKGWQWKHHTAETDTKGCEHCRDEVRKLTRTIMVDQLWMWILDENTIVTSYPRRYGHNKPDPSGVHKSIRVRLKTMPRYELRSAYDLALIILDECSNTFFDRTKARDNQPRLTDIFSESIGRIASKQTVLFDHLVHWTKEANRVYRSRTGEADSTRLHVPLLDIRREGKLQREIKDIIDELDMMMYLGAQQAKVLKRFKRLAQQMLSPVAAYKEPDRNSDILPALKTRTESWSLEEGAQSPGHGAGESSYSGPGHDCPSNRRKKYSWFSNHATVLMADVEDRAAELEGLKKSALSAAENIKELLSLKQQQASVVQAYESVRQAEETVKQGRSIMMFTIVTIIFVGASSRRGTSYADQEHAVAPFLYEQVWLRWGRTSRSVDAMTIRETELMKQAVEKKMRDDAEVQRKDAHCETHPDDGACGCSNGSTAVGSKESFQGAVAEHEERVQQRVAAKGRRWLKLLRGR
ncbi:hypothetical protein F5X68DRAFT_247974 [Plectosphaerella plurivora]|uniref:Uncharacterized protein n=1 Tax=Plectosphaerella plurivora TaxID=936078 RepID=A0A9P9ABN9_9PEZI|nr:hypothetical protein F5X68DRAFT_247974 [Plectosphaerella plurivora]